MDRSNIQEEGQQKRRSEPEGGTTAKQGARQLGATRRKRQRQHTPTDGKQDTRAQAGATPLIAWGLLASAQLKHTAS